jgi:DNA-binding NtrC family response regulator
LKALEIVLPNLREPIAVWFPGSPLVLPPIAQTGTLILHEVGALKLGEQYRLHEWIERAQGRIPGTRIVSTSEASLLPRVRAGVFLDRLYYRLNTVYIDISA